MTPHMKEPGYVYILTNPSFRDNWVKIGKSSRPVEQRVKVAEPLRSLRVPSLTAKRPQAAQRNPG